MFFLMHVHFDMGFLKCQNIVFCLLYSGLSKMSKYWIYKENVFSLTIMILFLLSFLGILSVWSDILQKEGNCTKEKNMSKITNEIRMKIQIHCIFGKNSS